jgi:NAD(P)-dependent dehydrogenase (short-subunit alcohol dehydrogenase family)
MSLQNRTILITGAARRLGRFFALTIAQAGGNIILHHGHSEKEAQNTAKEIEKLGVSCQIIAADLSHTEQAIETIKDSLSGIELYGLVNSAAIFDPIKFVDTKLIDWQRHMDINLTMPFLLSQLVAKNVGENEGKIVNILDWRALRPGHDHFPYTISKAALVAMTKALAIALAPNIQVNGLALGAILPPANGGNEDLVIKQVPAARWANLDEVGQTLLFLLDGPAYITGEIIHIDGGRHLV